MLRKLVGNDITGFTVSYNYLRGEGTNYTISGISGNEISADRDRVYFYVKASGLAKYTTCFLSGVKITFT